MSNPSQLFRRIRQRQGRFQTPARSVNPPAPAPVGASPDISPAPAPEPQAAPAAHRVIPRPMGGHSLYSQVMRSHDRMGTRHL